MPFKGLRSRPGTSSDQKRHTIFDSSNEIAHSNHGHKKSSSLKRLSLSFPPDQESPFQSFLLPEPDDLSPKDTSTAGPPKTFLQVKDEKQHHTNHTKGLDSESRPAVNDGDDRRSEKFAVNGAKTEEEAKIPIQSKSSSLRQASEPQMSKKYRQDGENTNGQPPPPTIITTAPTQHHESSVESKVKDKMLPRALNSFRRSMLIRPKTSGDATSTPSGASLDGGVSSTPDLNQAQVGQAQGESRSLSNLHSPPAYGDDTNTALAIPVSRLSDSSRSEGSSGSHKVYAQTTTTHVISTTTTFFKLKRKNKKKDKGPLFPLPEKLPPPSPARTSMSRNGGELGTGRKSMSPSRKSAQAVRFDTSNSIRESPIPSPTQSTTALSNAQLGSPGPAITRKHSTLSTHSGTSTPSMTLLPPRLGARGRSSTMGSIGRSSERLDSVPPSLSGRTSTSTTGRKSFGDIFSMSHRLRQNSAPPRSATGNSPSTPGSKSNSLQIPRESEPEMVYPQREDSDTPASYLEKLEAAVPRGAMATILCKSGDDFSKTCLRKYMRGFSYFGESIDMAIRKMLMEVILPKETQQIDRLLTGFADRYHECNPGVFINSDEANFVAFSILLLQSDSHNKNNKRKMTKQDYIKNTQNGKISVSDDILECFFDNICYTPFIHFEDDIAVTSHRLSVPRQKKSLIRTKSSETLRGPLDPYALILDNKLDVLRPSLKDVIETEDTYSSNGTMTSPNSNEYHKAFVNSAVLQIVSARSRPDAFMHQATISNPEEAQAGLVSIKVAKVGLLWRKSAKKKKAKSPWQEWGAILTDSKLYFFKDVGWVKKLMGQFEAHNRSKGKRGPLVFKPPVTTFEPDALMSMDDAVALLDMAYKKHKNAFTFIKHGGFEEVFLANSDGDMNDWIGKLNYAATFRTAGVRMRGLLGTTYEGRNLLRKDSERSTQTHETRQSEQSPPDTKQNQQMAWEINFYRRQLVNEKISSFDDHVAAAQKELDYLLRNSRHLLIQLPIQQKTREGIVFAAARMNAKLKWTRKEIWRARTHRDILIKDLEAEATSAFPAPTSAPTGTQPTVTGTSVKSTPTKTHASLFRQDTDNSTTKSPASLSPQSTRRPSQSILEQIQTDNAIPPELTVSRRKSTSAVVASSVKTSPTQGEAQLAKSAESKVKSPSLTTKPSTISSNKAQQEDDWPLKPETAVEDRATQEEGLAGSENKDERRGSEPERSQIPTISHTRDSSLKDRASSVRRSLHKTLRDPHHVHMPNHQRSKKGKESGSSVAATDDGVKSLSGESEELKRDPTGRFILHGKKASVITMSPEWQNLGADAHLKLREQNPTEAVVADGPKDEGDYNANPTDVASSVAVKSIGSNSIRSEVTGTGETFHSAPSSRRSSILTEDEDEDARDDDNDDDESTDEEKSEHDSGSESDTT